jgi:hypothetical protein
LKAETALEITGRKTMGPRNITADGRACCMLRTGRQSTPSGVRGIVHLSQDVFNVEDKQGLGPNLCVGICYSLDV